MALPNTIVKVWNRNSYDFKQMFKDSEIFIPATKHIEMDYFEAVDFLGKYHPIVMRKDGTQDPRSYKKLEIDKSDLKRYIDERDGQAKDEDDSAKSSWKCPVCTKDFKTQKGLLTHIKANHQDAMVDKEARDELSDREDI